MGYLPGMPWILAGVVFAGAVQDFVVLFISTRRDGKSLGDLIKTEMGPVAGVIALFGAFMIMVIILAVLAMIVVKALIHSPWGVFTVARRCRLPCSWAFICASSARADWRGPVIGFVLLMLAIVYGQEVAASPTLAPWFDYSGVGLTWILIIYGAVAAMLPVGCCWRRATIFRPFEDRLHRAAGGQHRHRRTANADAGVDTLYRRHRAGLGPGSLFPFLFITIACGAGVGLHALISPGTTPKLLENETQARLIGYGGMLMESGRCLDGHDCRRCHRAGVLRHANSPAALIGQHPSRWAQVVVRGFAVTPEVLLATAKDVGETTIISRWRRADLCPWAWRISCTSCLAARA